MSALKLEVESNPLSRAEEELLEAAVARLRTGVMSVVFSMVSGTGLFLATAWLLLRGGAHVGQHLGLLGNYFPGYSVTWPGAFLGFFYGGLAGGGLGWLMAWLYNRIVDLHHRRDPAARSRKSAIR